MAKTEKASKKKPKAPKVTANDTEKVTEAVIPKNKGGRPSIYTKELAAKICKKIATSTDGLKKMCRANDGFPNVDTIMEWRFDYPEFSVQYADAKRLQAELLAEEILDISDDNSQDEIISADGIVRPNTEFIARSRLRVDTRKWVACKLLPKVYGDKSEVTNTNIADEETKSTVSEIKKAVDLLVKHERDY